MGWVGYEEHAVSFQGTEEFPAFFARSETFFAFFGAGEGGFVVLWVCFVMEVGESAEEGS